MSKGIQQCCSLPSLTELCTIGCFCSTTQPIIVMLLAPLMVPVQKPDHEHDLYTSSYLTVLQWWNSRAIFFFCKNGLIQKMDGQIVERDAVEGQKFQEAIFVGSSNTEVWVHQVFRVRNIDIRNVVMVFWTAFQTKFGNKCDFILMDPKFKL